ncbi:MAG: transcriptional regulator GcvA [Alphaproteobacteria bacterium]
MPVLPSTQALRAFEAAARYLSFQQAAASLNLTPGAISRQIQSLEALLGQPLFLRRHKQVELTRAGRAYLDEIRAPLAQLAAATQRVRGGAVGTELSIWTNPTFALRWFIPRWSGLYARHPDIDIRLTTSLAPVDFGRDDIDLAVQVTDGRNLAAGLRAEPLVAVTLTPVCAPALAERLHAPSDLAGVTLLHSDPRPQDWPRWLQFAGIEGIDASRGLRFESTNLALQAAIEGLGVAVGIVALIGDDLAAGRLAQPYAPVRRTARPFQLIYPQARAGDPKLTACRDWLLAEAAAA